MMLRRLTAIAALSLSACLASAQVNPLSLLGRAVSTAMDARSAAEVAADAEISAGASKRLLEDKTAEWAGVTVLVFQQHVVLTGAVKTDAVRKRVEQVVRESKGVRSVRNEILVGDLGSLVRDTALEAEINATLTATSGLSSVNMRWSVTGGQAVLMGVARSREEAGLALSKVRGIKGVKKATSWLRIVPAKK